MVRLRAWLGTRERGDFLFSGRRSPVVFQFAALLELVVGAAKVCLTLLIVLLMLIHSALRIPATEFSLTSVPVMLTLLLTALRIRTPL